MEVSARFQTLLDNVVLTDAQSSDGRTKNHGVRKCLNSHYYNSSSETNNSLLIGSWGKSTDVRPPRDIDVLFELPESVYQRYESRPGNKQSQLLQEVKGVLQASYAATKMRADGQVVLVPFSSFAVEVAPAFKLTSGQYWICDTNNGGRYKSTDPAAEKKKLADSAEATKGNIRNLIRMMKRWQEYCNVPMASFWIELLAIEFLDTWQYRQNSAVYYDWMTRDFFTWLCNQRWHVIVVPGTYETINIGNSWHSKAESARDRSIKACENEAGKYPCLAGTEWQKIFGDFIPQC